MVHVFYNYACYYYYNYGNFYSQIAGLPIENQIFGLASKVDDEPWAIGILGLGRRSLARIKRETVLTSIVAQKILQQNKFGLYLKR